MGKFRIAIDLELCQGHGVCVADAPALFHLLETDAPYPQSEVLIPVLPEDLRKQAEKSARYCPNGAIKLIELSE